MKPSFSLAFVLLLCLLIACKGESSQTYESTNEIAAPSMEEAITIDSTIRAEEEILAQTTPEVIIKQRKETREKKKDSSIFNNEGCCSSEPLPVVCCCEPVLLKYLELLKSGDAGNIAKVRSEDPILNDCYKKIPSFKRKIDELEMSEEE